MTSYGYAPDFQIFQKSAFLFLHALCRINVTTVVSVKIGAQEPIWKSISKIADYGTSLDLNLLIL